MKTSGLKFYGALFAAAFGLNLIWEIGQLFAYQSKPGGGWFEALLFCSLASVIDAALTLAIYAFLRFLMKSGGAMFYLSAAVLGALCAVGFEWFALRFGLWSYGEQMIVLPILGVGLLPFVQLTLLVPLAIWLTRNSKMFDFINFRRKFGNDKKNKFGKIFSCRAHFSSCGDCRF